MGIVEDIAGSAMSANPVSAAISLGKDLIERFIPDPAAKAAAAQHLSDVQLQLSLAQIDQQNKIVEQASQNARGDNYLGAVRAGFCWMVIALMGWNYGVGPIFHQHPVDLPLSLITCFTTILLGFVGIPAGIEMAKQVAGMPGDSQVSILGLKVGNKS